MHRSRFERLLRTVVSRPRSVVALFLLASVAAVAFAADRLELRTSNLDLIDPGLPAVSDFRYFAVEFGTPNVLVVVLDGDRPDALRQAVDRLGPRLRGVAGVRGVLDRMPFYGGTAAVDGPSPYFESKDHGLCFIFVRPDDPLSRASTIEPFVRGVQQVIVGAGLDELGVRAGLTGMPKYALDDRDGVQHDLSRLSLLSFGLVLVLFVSAFRTWRRPLLAMVGLLISVALTLGAISIYPGHLTLLSAFFATILFGLGIDYSIHLIARVEEQVDEGLDERSAAVAAARTTGRAIATGALTTCAVFLAMVFCGFRGFAELGVVAGIGVLICLGVTLTLLPALLTLFPGRPSTTRSTGSSRTGSLLSMLGRPATATLVALAALGGLVFGVPKFDRDYLALQSAGSDAVRLEREMVSRSDLSPSFAAFVVPTRESAAELATRLGNDPTVGRVYSIAALDLMELVTGRPIPDDMRDGLVGHTGQFAVYAWPAGDVWSEPTGEGFVAHMRAIDPHVTGMPILGEFMVERSRRALWISGAIGGGALLVCLLFDFRRPVPALLAALPALCTIPLMFAGMGLLGIDFNPLNVMALPVILGIAVDDGIHIVHRFLEERGRIEIALAGTGRAVVLTSLTTLAAFGSLAFASHRGLASFGAVVALGVGAALLLSVVLLPAVLRMARGRLGAVGVLASLLLLATFTALPARADGGVADAEARGDAAWAERANGFEQRGVPDGGPVRLAIDAWTTAAALRPDEPRLRFKLIEAVYFESEFVDSRPENRRAAHDRMVELSAEAVDLVASRADLDTGWSNRPLEEQAKLLAGVPDAAEAQLWSAVSWGLWGMSHGYMASASRDVARRIRDHATLLEAINDRYADGAGPRILGRLHTVTPRVPMFTGWIRRKFGIDELRRANSISTEDPRNPLFLAEALWRLEPEKAGEARTLLVGLTDRRPRPAMLVEDTALLDQARGLLQEMDSR